MKKKITRIGSVKLFVSYIIYMILAICISTSAFYCTVRYLSNHNGNIRIATIDSDEAIDKINNDNNMDVNIHIQRLNNDTLDAILVYATDSYLIILFPIFVLAGVIIGTAIFYVRKIRKPIKILGNAAYRIASNDLNFSIQYDRNDEMGILCDTFETMRSELYENNIKTWRTIDEAKRVQATFSHDMRTPMTVIQGYADYLEMYVPQKKVSEEKLLDTIKKINSNISRLINFTVSMSMINKFDDRKITPLATDVKHFFKNIEGFSSILCKEKELTIETDSDCDHTYLDCDTVNEVAENIISNAVRFAESKVKIRLTLKDNLLTLAVQDDGKGFSKNALLHATEAFFTENTQNSGRNENFGIGLSVSSILCKKYGGNLMISNNEAGALVTATFNLKSV